MACICQSLKYQNTLVCHLSFIFLNCYVQEMSYTVVFISSRIQHHAFLMYNFKLNI